MTIDQINTAIGSASMAMVASCKCLTKTHVPDYHDDNCPYKLLQEAVQKLKQAKEACFNEPA
jgi:hypothetical protein